MPELPEVESRLQYLKRTALGQVVERVEVTEDRILKCCGAASFKRGLRGRRLEDAYRRGKYLIIGLDNGRSLILHFTMGGDLKYYRNPSERPRFTRLEFFLTNGYRLAFTCPRNICRVMLVDSLSEIAGLRAMGPEPLDNDFTITRLREVISSRRSRQIKSLLMDQNSIAGIGNIYADEILFQAGIRPDRRASSLSPPEARKLHKAIRKVLGAAITTGGDEELPEHFLISREMRGEGCPGEHPIEKIRIIGRTTRFCPDCQN